MSTFLRTLIRGLIREALESGLSELQMGNIRDELRKSKVFSRLDLDVDDFAGLPDNSVDWKRIFSNGSIKYLGSGRQGSAFSLGGDKILKLQPGRPRAGEIEDALYSGSDVGEGLPSILDTGMFSSNIGPIGWSIVEKVQSAGEIGEDPEWKVLWRAVTDGIAEIVKGEQKSISDRERALKKKGVKPEDFDLLKDFELGQELPGSYVKKFTERSTDEVVKKLLPMMPRDVMSSVEERYRLAPDWFTKFIKGIQSHYRLGMVDFKPDNMGIRRVRGGEGEVIFFDAASARLRDIKKWEPK